MRIHKSHTMTALFPDKVESVIDKLEVVVKTLKAPPCGAQTAVMARRRDRQCKPRLTSHAVFTDINDRVIATLALSTPIAPASCALFIVSNESLTFTSEPSVAIAPPKLAVFERSVESVSVSLPVFM